jgi:hypothetical protein
LEDGAAAVVDRFTTAAAALVDEVEAGAASGVNDKILVDLGIAFSAGAVCVGSPGRRNGGRTAPGAGACRRGR